MKFNPVKFPCLLVKSPFLWWPMKGTHHPWLPHHALLPASAADPRRHLVPLWVPGAGSWWKIIPKWIQLRGLWLGSPHCKGIKKSNLYIVHLEVWPSIRAKGRNPGPFGGTNCVERCSYHHRQSRPNSRRLRAPMFFFPCSLCARLWCWAQRPASVSLSLGEQDSGAQKHQIHPSISAGFLKMFVSLRSHNLQSLQKKKCVFPFELI